MGCFDKYLAAPVKVHVAKNEAIDNRPLHSKDVT